MNSRLHPLVWLLCGFALCAALVAGFIRWRGIENPFAPANPPAPPLTAGVPPATPPPPMDEAESAPSESKTPPPPAPTENLPPEPVDPAAALPPEAAQAAIQAAAASPGLTAITALSSLAAAGTVPRQALIDAAWQWGTQHLPGDLTDPDAPFEEVTALLKNSTIPEERGFAALALAGSGRAAEALEAIQTALDAAKPEAPERLLIEEALKLATAIPEETPPLPDNSNLKATAPTPPVSVVPPSTDGGPTPAKIQP